MRSVVKHFSFTGTPDIERAHLRNSIRTQLSGYFLDDIPENIDLLLGEEGRGLLDGHRVTGKHACQNHLRTFWSNVADF